MDIIRLDELPMRTSDIDTAALNFAHHVMEDGDPIKVMVQLKQIETYTDSVKKYLKSLAADIAQRRQVDSVLGAKIEVRSPAKYDYSNCNDPIWNYCKAQIEDLETLKKGREMYLKSIKNQTSYVDTETGEEFTIVPPMATYQETIYITLPKK